MCFYKETVYLRCGCSNFGFAAACTNMKRRKTKTGSTECSDNFVRALTYQNDYCEFYRTGRPCPGPSPFPTALVMSTTYFNLDGDDDLKGRDDDNEKDG